MSTVCYKEVGTFTSPASATPQTQDVTLTGFSGVAPSFIVVWTTGQTAAGTAAICEFAIGFGTSATNRAAASMHEDEAFTTEDDRAHTGAGVIWLLQSAGDFTPPTTLERGDIASFAADKFTIDWEVTSATAYRYHYIAFYGDEIEANVVSFVANTVDGAQAVAHGLGGVPTGVLGISCHSIIAPPSIDEAAHADMTIFASDLTTDRWTGIAASEGSTARGQKAVAAAHSDLGGIPEESTITSADATNLTFDWEVSDGFALAEYYHLLVVRGITFEVGTFTSPATAIDKVVTTAIEPELFINWGWMDVQSAAQQTTAQIMFGASDGTNQAAGGVLINEGAGQADRFDSSTKCLAAYTASTMALREDASAAISGADVTLTFSTAETAANEFNYVAIGCEAVEVPVPPPLPAASENIFTLDTTSSEITTYRATLPVLYPTSAPVRPGGRNSKKLTQASNSHKIWAVQNHEVFTGGTGTQLIMERFSDYGEKHMLCAMHGPVHDAWDGTGGGYLKANTDIEILATITISDDGYTLAEYKNGTNNPWLVMFEGWQNTAGMSSGDVPLQIIIDQLVPATGDNQVLLRLRGSTETTPTAYTAENSFLLDDVVIGSHDLKIQVKFDYTGVDAYCRVWWNDVLKVDTTQSIGINRVGNTELGSWAPLVGNYQSDGATSTGSKIICESLEINHAWIDKIDVRSAGIAEAAFAAAFNLSGGAPVRTYLLSGQTVDSLRNGTVTGVKLKTYETGHTALFVIFRGGTRIFKGTATATVIGITDLNIAGVPAMLAGDKVGVQVSVSAKTSGKANTGVTLKYNNSDATTEAALLSSLANFDLDLQVTMLSADLNLTGDSVIEGHNTATSYHGYLDTVPGGNAAAWAGTDIETALSFELENQGKGSSTFSDVDGTFLPLIIARNPRRILIHAGVNDVSTGRTWGQVETDLDSIRAAVASNVRLYISEILPWTAGTDGNAATIRTFNANFATWCSANNATLILTHDAMGQNRVSTGELDDLLTSYDQDGLHLTTAGVAAFSAILSDAM